VILVTGGRSRQGGLERQKKNLSLCARRRRERKKSGVPVYGARKTAHYKKWFFEGGRDRAAIPPSDIVETASQGPNHRKKRGFEDSENWGGSLGNHVPFEMAGVGHHNSLGWGKKDGKQGVPRSRLY